MPVPALTGSPVLGVPPVAPKQEAEGSQGYEKTIKKVIEIAIQVLIPFALTILVYCTLPWAISVVIMPVAFAISSLVILCFAFMKVQATAPAAPVAPLEPPEPPLLADAPPCGLQNAGNDCWLNSLLQMIRIDRGISKWFREVPLQFETHVRYLRIFNPDQLANLPDPLPPEWLADLSDAERQSAIGYANIVRGYTPEKREKLLTYLRFVYAKETEEERAQLAVALLAFKTFIRCYDETPPGQPVLLPVAGEDASRELYSSAALRLTLHSLSPESIQQASVQQDSLAGLEVIDRVLLPSHLRMELEVRTVYDIQGKPPLADLLEGHIGRRTEPQAVIRLPIKGDAPNVQDLFDRISEEPNPEGRITRQVDSVNYEYQVLKIQNQFAHPPESLWISFNRLRQISPHSAGLHRLLPDLFDAKPMHPEKLSMPIDVQEILHVQTATGPARYRHDGSVVHLGGSGGGHYVALVPNNKEDPSKEAWFQASDQQVSILKSAQLREQRGSAVVHHYSKIEEGAE